MSLSEADLSERVASLREAFDRTFADPVPARVSDRILLLAVRVRGEPYILRNEDLAGISLNRKIVPLTGSAPELVGLAGARGKLLAVYRLAAFLGHLAESGPEPWVAQCSRDPSVGLSFGGLEGYIEVDPASLHHVASGEKKTNHVHELLRDGSTVRAVVDIPSVLTAIQQLAKAEKSRSG